MNYLVFVLVILANACSLTGESISEVHVTTAALQAEVTQSDTQLTTPIVSTPTIEPLQTISPTVKPTSTVEIQLSEAQINATTQIHIDETVSPTRELPPSEPTSLADAVLTATPDLTDAVTQTTIYTSPTGSWQVSLIQTYASNRTVYQRFIATSDEYEVTAAERWTYSGLGSDSPRILQWSTDETVIWYGFFGAPDGCSVGGFWTEITRLNLLTGEETLIGDNVYDVPAPDDKTYIDIVNSTLSVQNRLDESEQIISLPIVEGQILGMPNWASSSELIAFVVTERNDICSHFNSILYVDLVSGSVQQTQFSDNPLLFIKQWESNELLSLVDANGENWLLNVQSGDLTKQQ